jgi:hypothetical protein
METQGASVTMETLRYLKINLTAKKNISTMFIILLKYSSTEVIFVWKKLLIFLSGESSDLG